MILSDPGLEMRSALDPVSKFGRVRSNHPMV